MRKIQRIAAFAASKSADKNPYGSRWGLYNSEKNQLFGWKVAYRRKSTVMAPTWMITRRAAKNRRPPYLLVLLGRDHLWWKWTILIISINQLMIAYACFRSRIDFIELCFTFVFLTFKYTFGRWILRNFQIQSYVFTLWIFLFFFLVFLFPSFRFSFKNDIFITILRDGLEWGW